MRKKGIIAGAALALLVVLAATALAVPTVVMTVEMDTEFSENTGVFSVSILADRTEDEILAHVSIQEDGKAFFDWDMEGDGMAFAEHRLLVQGGSTYTMTVEPAINGEKQTEKSTTWSCPEDGLEANGSSIWGTMYHTKTGAQVSLGMTREEVEAQLGEPANPELEAEEKGFCWMARYGSSSEDEVIVWYDTEREDVVQIDLQSDNYYGKTNWCLVGGLKKGAAEEDILAVYGDDSAYYHREENQVAFGSDPEDKTEVVSLLYSYDAEHNLLERVPPMNAEYLVHFILLDGALDSYGVISMEYAVNLG